MIKIKKGIPVIDQHDKSGFWGGKFGGNFIPETLKKPVEDLAAKQRAAMQALKQRRDSENKSNSETVKQDNVKPKHQICSWFFTPL